MAANPGGASGGGSEQGSGSGNPPATYTVTLTSDDSDMGSVKIDDVEAGATASKTVAAGTQVTIQAIPGNDYSFSRWSDNEGLATRTITVNSDISLSAAFGIGD